MLGGLGSEGNSDPNSARPTTGGAVWRLLRLCDDGCHVREGLRRALVGSGGHIHPPTNTTHPLHMRGSSTSALTTIPAPPICTHVQDSVHHQQPPPPTLKARLPPLGNRCRELKKRVRRISEKSVQRVITRWIQSTVFGFMVKTSDSITSNR